MKQTVLAYLEKYNKYLMLYRNKKNIDINKGKYIGVGGHVEANETPDEALIREVKEETGLDVKAYKKNGIVYFILNGYEEEMHVYTSKSFTGDLIECDEGQLSWVNKNEIFSLNLWEGDKYFLKLLLNDSDFFKMRLIYQDDKLIKVENLDMEIIDNE